MAKLSMTASDLLRELASDPEYLSAKAERDERFHRLETEYAEAEAPLVQALNRQGAGIASVWDLVNRKEPYPDLIPVLLSHIGRPYPDRVLEGIGRALAVPEARQGWRTLVDAFLASPDTSATGSKWALALAIGEAADPSTLDELIHLVHDPRHGETRLAFVAPLSRLTDPKARETLDFLQGDPLFAHEIRRCRALGHKVARKASAAGC